MTHNGTVRGTATEEQAEEQAGKQVEEQAVAVRILPHGEGLDLPQRASAGSVGYDLRAAISDKVMLEVRKPLAIPCGIALALPNFMEAQIRPRSGLALKHAITCLNAPGTIDSDYRGEIKVILVNHGDAPFVIERGLRIAQIVFARFEIVRFLESPLDATERGCKGFGASGKLSFTDEPA